MDFNPTDYDDPTQMRAAAAVSMRDPELRYRAAATVEAMDMVNEHVPDANHRVTDEWVRQVIAECATRPVPLPWLSHDPMFVTARDLIAYHLDSLLPVPPKRSQCERCQSWELQFERLEFGFNPTKRVFPVHLAGGQRVVEVLLCQECIDTLGVEPS